MCYKILKIKLSIHSDEKERGAVWGIEKAIPIMNSDSEFASLMKRGLFVCRLSLKLSRQLSFATNRHFPSPKHNLKPSFFFLLHFFFIINYIILSLLIFSIFLNFILISINTFKYFTILSSIQIF